LPPPQEVAQTFRVIGTDSRHHGGPAGQRLPPGLNLGQSIPEPEIAYGIEHIEVTEDRAEQRIDDAELLTGKNLGPIRIALYTARRVAPRSLAQVDRGEADWIAPDDALPSHPSVVWRKRHFPKVLPRYRTHSILSVLELIALGLGVGVVPEFLAQGRKDVMALTEPLDDCTTDLWLLAHPESRHLRRVNTVYSHLSQAISLP
jgi:DNA-binding transcriptional LysR family regulator